MSWQDDENRANSAALGGEAYLKLNAGQSLMFLPNVAIKPHYREQSWPQGQPPIIAPQGSGQYPEHVEICGWAWIGGKWQCKVIDAPLRQVAAIIRESKGVEGRVLKITKNEGPHPTNRAWRVVTYAAEVAREGVQVGPEVPRVWPIMKGKPMGAVVATPRPPVTSPTHLASVSAEPDPWDEPTPPDNGGGDLPF